MLGLTKPSPMSSTPPPAGSTGTTTAGSTAPSEWSRPPNTSKPTTLPSTRRSSPHENGTKAVTLHFTAKQRGEGRVALEVELGVLGVRFDHSRPYHPQTCGKVERFHQTQKKWLAAQTPATTIRALQGQLDRFAGYYNTTRPHRSIGRRTPAQAYADRPKAIPTGIKIPAHYRVRNDTIDSGGTVTLRHNSRLHHIGLGAATRGTHVTLLIDDLHIRVIGRDTGQLIRELILDPTRDYQSLVLQPGPPKKATK